ncbi:drap deaminase [Niveomyces insectorum RCEF 264]|uniref:Drap deaminase n=1 Tax=Niveomyces insectorum RCEF 264 TaxID=1081102 RepID=A0A167UVJ4_9HYPO|nr:drap deaminase [Niveomyces insectorum RCEF 264]
MADASENGGGAGAGAVNGIGPVDTSALPHAQPIPDKPPASDNAAQETHTTDALPEPRPHGPSGEPVKPKTAKLGTSDDAATTAHAGATTTAAAAMTTTPSLPKDTTTTTTTTSSLSLVPWPKPYLFEAGLRRVEPYYYTYNTWVKERWRGRTLLAVFESEFRDRPLAYYRAAMESGAVAVNGQTVGPDHVLQNGERISHTTHRHEPPVTADPVGIIHEDGDMLVINKPAGVPVHPAGRYLYNSVVEILKAERGPDFVPYPCNRLDRLTSGIMFLAKSPATAKRLSLQIQAHAVRKEYLARVVGRFPDGEVVCDQPILQISPKLGLNRVRANGRSARTVFKRLAYYGPETAETAVPSETAITTTTTTTATAAAAATAEAEPSSSGNNGPPSPSSSTFTPSRTTKGYSIVRCLPVTGRTHQIRVHLQFLGHPIENDPIYANQRVWGLDLGCGDADASHHADEDIIRRLARMGKEDVAAAVAYYDEMVDAYHTRKAEKMSGALCAVCRTPLYTDPGAHELALWLHSLRYAAADGSWSYVSPLPAWALPPDGARGPTEVGGLEELVGVAEATARQGPTVEAEAEAPGGEPETAKSGTTADNAAAAGRGPETACPSPPEAEANIPVATTG